MITAERLRELLDYDPETGLFRWKMDRPKAIKGDVAGCVATRDGGKQYRIIRISTKGSKNYYAHRLVFLWMNGVYPTKQIDHIDGDGLNNRWSNLRECTPKENALNKRAGTLNKTGYLGVHQVSSGLFVAQIAGHGERKQHLLPYQRLLNAKARDDEAKKLHGEFAYLNKVSDEAIGTRRKIRSDKRSSKFRGVFYRPHIRRFAAAIKGRHLGYFDVEEDAAHAYDKAARSLYGEKAVVNFS